MVECSTVSWVAARPDESRDVTQLWSFVNTANLIKDEIICSTHLDSVLLKDL